MIAALAAAALLAGWTQVGTGPDGGTSRSGSTLRHLQLFGGLGAWDGYFTPLRDGPLAHATRAQLAAHDPAAPSEPAAASPSRTSSGRLHLRHELWLLPPADRGHFWGATVPSALQFAVHAFRSRGFRGAGAG
jgi:hypothetical protein